MCGICKNVYRHTDEFKNVVWTNESSVQLRRHGQTRRVKIGKESQLKPQAKHTLKVDVWADVSARGATNICIFDQTMDATLCIKILQGFLLPFIKEKFQGSGYRFMQDNDSNTRVRRQKNFISNRESISGPPQRAVLT